jgi:hypothetical protein
MGPHIQFPPGKNIVVPSSAPAAFHLHELGHAQNYATRFGKILRATRNPGMLLAGAAGTVSAVSKKDSDVSKYAPAVAAAGMAPMLADETMASMRAIQSAKKLGITGTELRGLKGNLGKAFTSYGAMTGVLVGTPMLIRKLKKQPMETIG